MIKHIAFSGLALAIGLGFASPVWAQATDSDSETVGIVGNVARICVLGPPSTPTVNLGQLVNTSGANIGRIAAIGPQSVILPNSFCNFAGSALTVTATALTVADTTPLQTGFARAVNYTATATNWTGAPTALTTTASASGAGASSSTVGDTQPAPRIADVGVGLSAFTVPGNALLVAGGYAGQVTVTLGPVATTPQ